MTQPLTRSSPWSRVADLTPWLLGLIVGVAVVVALYRDATAGTVAPRWALVAEVLVASTAVASVAHSRVGERPVWVPLMLLGSCLAVYLCVPETSDQMATVGTVVAVAIVIEMVVRRALPIALHAALIGVVLWAGMYGASGRASAYVGALFALAPELLAGLVTRREALVLITALLATIVVARTGALERTIGPALVAAGIATGVCLLAVVVGRRSPVRHPHPGTVEP